MHAAEEGEQVPRDGAGAGADLETVEGLELVLREAGRLESGEDVARVRLGGLEPGCQLGPRLSSSIILEMRGKAPRVGERRSPELLTQIKYSHALLVEVVVAVPVVLAVVGRLASVAHVCGEECGVR